MSYFFDKCKEERRKSGKEIETSKRKFVFLLGPWRASVRR
jgi:hypothetical protein